MASTGTDRIEKRIELTAPVARGWRALTDPGEFGTWFRVNLEGPFAPGKPTRGHITHPGYEHLVMEVVVQTMEPPTLVEFTLEKTPTGTLLTLTESGFDALPPAEVVQTYR